MKMMTSRFSIPILMGLVSAVGCGGDPQMPLDAEPVENQASDPVVRGDPASGEIAKRQGALFVEVDRDTDGDGETDRVEFVFNCGATYIGKNSAGKNWVLTAAHCVTGDGNRYRVAFGKARLSEYTRGDYIPVNAVKVHPDYNREDSLPVGDIALLRVPRRPDATVSRLANTGTDARVNETVTISGFGLDDVLGSISDQVLSADTRVVGTGVCAQFFGEAVGDGLICSSDLVGKLFQDSCNGDSGGPMYRSDFTQVGITSFGIRFCIPLLPSAYTRVAFYRKWIRNNSGI